MNQTPTEQLARIVVVAPNWLGDAVMALPAIRDIRRHFSGSGVAIAARPSVAALFRAVPGTQDIVPLSSAEGMAAAREDVRLLRAHGFEIGILLPNSFRSAWTLRAAGVRERWGFRSDMRGLLLTRAMRRPKRKVHFGEYYQHLVRGLGIETGPLTPRVEVPPATAAAADRLLRDRGWEGTRALVAVAPGAAFGHAKRYPPDRFAAVITALRDDLNAVCILIGRDEDRDAVQKVEQHLRATAGRTSSVIDLTGRTDLLMLIGVLSHCHALVGNDSGALHLAAAIGVPVAAIFGPTDERYSTPLVSLEGAADRVMVFSHDVFCRPCFLCDCPIDHRCMKRIPPDRVIGGLRSLVAMSFQPNREVSP